MTARANLCVSDACPDTQRFLDHIDRGSPLELDEALFLLARSEHGIRHPVSLAARQIRQRVFGARVALFAPLYLSNECTNNCLYCGFRRDNRAAIRRTLTVMEAVEEAKALAGEGLRRILLVAAEHPAKVSIQYLCQVVRAIREETPISAVAVNVAPMSTKALCALRDSGALAYQCFQETYQPEVYRRIHPSGNKRDYAWRAEVMDRAIAAGFTQIGVGVLLGLGNLQADVWAMLAHVRSLLGRHRNLEVILSFPRIRPALGAALAAPLCPVSDEDFAHAVAVCRLALPSAEIAISTRERAEFRDGLMELGATMMSAGSVTFPGGYRMHLDMQPTRQFAIEDTRSVARVDADLRARGLIPAY